MLIPVSYLLLTTNIFAHQISPSQPIKSLYGHSLVQKSPNHFFLPASSEKSIFQYKNTFLIFQVDPNTQLSFTTSPISSANFRNKSKASSRSATSLTITLHHGRLLINYDSCDELQGHLRVITPKGRYLLKENGCQYIVTNNSIIQITPKETSNARPLFAPSYAALKMIKPLLH